MDALMEKIVAYPNATYAERQELAVSVRRFVLAGMESGNPSAVRTTLREYAEFDANAAYALRAEVVSVYGTDI